MMNFALYQALSTMQQYPTKVHFCVVTNQPERLKLAIQPWATPDVVCHPDGPLDHPFKLAFVHRAYMEKALKRTDPGAASEPHTMDKLSCTSVAICRIALRFSSGLHLIQVDGPISCEQERRTAMSVSE